MTCIRANGLTKRYGDVLALDGVSFSVNRGEVIGLLGPNGAGKTTLMKLLTGYLQPDDGTAEVLGMDVVDERLAVQARLGYLPENAPLYEDMLVQDYLSMMAEFRGVAAANRLGHLSDAVYATGLEQHLIRPIAALSKGYRQRVGIAQAIVHKPEVLILDEPTTGLDPTQIVEIRDLLARLSEHSTVLLSTHILSEVEATCERVLLIAGGRLRTDASLEELRSGNAAVVSINSASDGETADIEGVLTAIDGVARVEPLGADTDNEGFKRWRVVGSDDRSLCPVLYQALQKHPWQVAELRRESRELESVFRELVQQTEEPAAKAA